VHPDQLEANCAPETRPYLEVKVVALVRCTDASRLSGSISRPNDSFLTNAAAEIGVQR
jgi:hypothetical protein